MRVSNLFTLFNKWKFGWQMRMIPIQCSSFNFIKNHTQIKCISTGSPLKSTYEDDSSSDDEMSFNTSHMNIFPDGYVRDLLFKDTRDLLLQRIYCCASVEELFRVFEKNTNSYNDKHLTQTVFVLYDLLRIYTEVSSLQNATNEPTFYQQLEENSTFGKFLHLIEEQLPSFDLNSLSLCGLYLNKLGLSLENKVLEKICNSLKNRLIKQFSLKEASRFLQIVFSDVSLRSYFMAQDLIPFVFSELKTCSTVEDLNNLAISLNKLRNFVNKSILEEFRSIVEKFIEEDKLNSSDYKTVLNIIQFLNYPSWRDYNSLLVSKCIMLIQGDIHNMDINEIILLFEIFNKIEEPGVILNDLQRCTHKHFNRLDEIPTTHKLRLFMSILFFTSPHLRQNAQKRVANYVRDCNNFENLLLLRRLLLDTKTTNQKVTHLFWSKMLNLLNTNNRIDVVKLSQLYVNFNITLPNQRHLEFETKILKDLKSTMLEGYYQFIPQKIAGALNFTLLYCDDKVFVDYLVRKLEHSWDSVRAIEYLKLSHTLRAINDLNYQRMHYARRIDKVINKYVNGQLTKVDEYFWTQQALLKMCVQKNRLDTGAFTWFPKSDILSSKTVENLYYCFLVTNTCIPQILDNIAEYISSHRDNILGFNIGKIVYLFYELGYRPNVKNFFQIAIDIIIRDQERMTGLSVIYSCLALCYFNNFPTSLIKSIFNVEFMDKLDSELEQCYSKDKYPNRVRSYLMQLNRAVCLDYPESNVPWFHEKYINENLKTTKPSLFAVRVREYLNRILADKTQLCENVITPYGYHIDYVIKINDQTSLALLLLPEFAYTKFVPHLKGVLKMKIRHLEILGYKVVLVKFSDWMGLFYDEERINFLQGLITPNEIEINRVIVKEENYLELFLIILVNKKNVD